MSFVALIFLSLLGLAVVAAGVMRLVCAQNRFDHERTKTMKWRRG